MILKFLLMPKTINIVQTKIGALFKNVFGIIATEILVVISHTARKFWLLSSKYSHWGTLAPPCPITL